MKATLLKLWRTLSRPSVHLSLGVLTLGGFLAGIIFWGAFNTGMDLTNEEEFCISCHTMRDTNYVEFQETPHFQNTSGVTAQCADCHVPHNLVDKIPRKVAAVKDIIGEFFGGYDTPEDFQAKRLEMAQREWDRMSANGSAECKNCHSYDRMDFENMRPTARIQMKQAAERDQSCIDCHKGIAHHLPEDMNQGGGALAELDQMASNTSFTDGEEYVSVRYLPLYTAQDLATEAGLLNPASTVKVVAQTKDAVQVEIAGWRKDKGFGRVIQEDFGMNIAVASLLKESATNDDIVAKFEGKVDELTGLPWQRVTATVWMKKESLLDDVQPIWDIAAQTYSDGCSVCHTQPEEAHFDTNTWPGMFNGMLAFVSFDRDTQAMVLKYLQKHSSDFSDAHH